MTMTDQSHPDDAARAAFEAWKNANPLQPDKWGDDWDLECLVEYHREGGFHAGRASMEREVKRLRKEQQRPSPEGLHAQRLREFGQALAAGMTSDEFLIPEGVDFFGDQANNEGGRCAEPRERAEEQNQETPQEAPASTLPSALPPSSPVPWHALRAAVREPIRRHFDQARDDWSALDSEDDMVEAVCRAALREIGEAEAGEVEPWKNAAHYWKREAERLQGHAPSAARKKPERPKPIVKPPYTQPPHEPRLRCKLGLHRWENLREFFFPAKRCSRCGKERTS